MFYRFELTIPADTPKDSPAELEVNLVPGIIHRVEISFPPGPQAMVYVAIYEGIHQVWPTNPDEAFHWDNYTVAFDERYELRKPAFLTIKGWSPGTTYDHTVAIRLGILPEEAAWTIEELLAAVMGVPTPVGAG